MPSFLAVVTARLLKHVQHLAFENCRATRTPRVSLVLASDSPNDNSLAVPAFINWKIPVADGKFKMAPKDAAYLIAAVARRSESSRLSRPIAIRSFQKMIAISSVKTFSSFGSEIVLTALKYSLANSDRSLWVSSMTFLAKMPCRKVLWPELDFPFSVRGPVEDFALAGLAARTESSNGLFMLHQDILLVQRSRHCG